ncbi:MAG: BCCT family transporter [Spirochaetaceae bacterium]
MSRGDTSTGASDVSNSARFSQVPLILAVTAVLLLTTVMVTYPGWILGVIRAVHRFLRARGSAAYVLSASFFAGAALYLAFSRHGHSVIGLPGERPRFGTGAWVTLLFSGGLGLGVLFLGVSDTMRGFAAPSSGVTPYSPAAAREALETVFLQWGLHMWAMPLVTGLALTWFSLRQRASMRVSSTLFPFLGFRCERWTGHSVDAIVLIGSLVAGSTVLGLSAMQFASGVTSIFGVPDTAGLVLLSLLLLTTVPMVLLLLKRHRQVQLLRQPVSVTAGVLALLLFILGPGSWLISLFSTVLGEYLSDLPASALAVGSVANGNAPAEQSLFHWAFWVIWAPFTGVFLASVSRGRTIRSFVLAVLTIPALGTLFVVSMTAGAGLYLELEQGVLVADSVVAAPESALFVILSGYRLSLLLRVLAILIVGVLGVVMVDSSSWFLARLSYPEESQLRTPVRMLWLLLVGILAAVVFVAGGLTGFRSLVIVTSLPVLPLLLFAFAGFVRALRYNERTGSAAVIRNSDSR